MVKKEEAAEFIKFYKTIFGKDSLGSNKYSKYISVDDMDRLASLVRIGESYE